MALAHACEITKIKKNHSTYQYVKTSEVKAKNVAKDDFFLDAFINAIGVTSAKISMCELSELL